ncbi:unnamed protein product [Thlaspi arvense]|uniref:NB-ARC domain-containing protein n=1 Tax=Thlaspi arvense TaxID=13288 RepID=A0AAU9RLW3_THLAR|nr:unnamed protein product [Thlaspi arvense]
MATEITLHHGLGKGDFRQRFYARCEEWIAKNQVLEESKHPSSVLLVEEDRAETKPAVPDHEIYGFNNEIKSLEDFLLDQKVYREFMSLVIVGEYGVGKTALCQMIFNNENVKTTYAPRIWISMHSNESKEGVDGKIYVLKKILKGLGVEGDVFESIHREAEEEAANSQEAGEIDGETGKEKELSALLYALHLDLRWKKYLIVFDDVREEDHWNEMLQEGEVRLKKDDKWGKYLSDGFPKGSGGRVIYTTRDQILAKKLVAEKHEIHRLWPLSDPHSLWRIYDAEVTKQNKYPPSKDKKCVDELMNKSRGLPLAVRLMATLKPVYLDDELYPEDNATYPLNTSGY